MLDKTKIYLPIVCKTNNIKCHIMIDCQDLESHSDLLKNISQQCAELHGVYS